jgi:uncharacterized membrane protein YdjX (TVP38/TMEM64 family)
METTTAQRPSPWRFLPLALIVLALGGARAAGLHRYVSLDTLTEQGTALMGFVQTNLVLALAIFILVYAVATAIALPSGLALSLTGGFLFGTWLGGGAIVIGATAGAVALFLAARSALGDWLRGKLGGWLEKLAAGFRENAFGYLLSLRLLPLAPFVVVNLAPAFLGVKLRDYVGATFIGIIPATFVYASVGNGLRVALETGESLDPAAAIRTLLFQPAVFGPILALAALSLAPAIFKYFKGHSSKTTQDSAQ